MDKFKSVSLDHWRQFERIEIDLDTSLVVLTGANGCGKTTILNVLGRHFGWNINFSSTPYLGARREKKFWSDVYEQRSSDAAAQPGMVQVGTIEYLSGIACELLVPSSSDNNQYSPTYSNQRSVDGIHIPSHRPITSYAPIDQIPVNPKTNQQHFQEFQQLLFQTYGHTNTKNPSLVLKQSLVALALFGYGNDFVQPNFEYRRLFEGFQDVLRALLPNALGFERLEIRMPDVVLVTRSGQFPLDSMSGGISAIVGMAWQIHMYGVGKTGCTVLIDEPENHLHPSMQRQFLPSLLAAFPSYRFVVATHSPFVVSSSAEAFVYGLIFNEDGRIRSSRISEADLAGSPNKILREILDVPTTIPIWAEKRIAALLEKYQRMPAQHQDVEALYQELREQGLDQALQGFGERE